MVSTHLKNICQNGFIFPKVRGENKKYLKPPPRKNWSVLVGILKKWPLWAKKMMNLWIAMTGKWFSLAVVELPKWKVVVKMGHLHLPPSFEVANMKRMNIETLTCHPPPQLFLSQLNCDYTSGIPYLSTLKKKTKGTHIHTCGLPTTQLIVRGTRAYVLWMKNIANR